MRDEKRHTGPEHSAAGATWRRPEHNYIVLPLLSLCGASCCTPSGCRTRPHAHAQQECRHHGVAHGGWRRPRDRHGPVPWGVTPTAAPVSHTHTHTHTHLPTVSGASSSCVLVACGGKRDRSWNLLASWAARAPSLPHQLALTAHSFNTSLKRNRRPGSAGAAEARRRSAAQGRTLRCTGGPHVEGSAAGCAARARERGARAQTALTLLASAKFGSPFVVASSPSAPVVQVPPSSPHPVAWSRCPARPARSRPGHGKWRADAGRPPGDGGRGEDVRAGRGCVAGDGSEVPRVRRSRDAAGEAELRGLDRGRTTPQRWVQYTYA